MARRVTMRDVATSLGVSTTTVSNAFSRPDQLSVELRERVLDHARELGYGGPDPTARGLRTGRTWTVGVVFTERLSFAFAEPTTVTFLEGLARQLEQAGLGVLLLPATRTDGVNDEPAAGAVARAAVDGFVLYSVAADAPEALAATRSGRPTVVVDSPAPADVTVDDASGAAAVMRHVLDLGHRDLAVLSFRVGTDGRSGLADADRRASTPFAVTAARFEGFERALDAARSSDPDVPRWRDVAVYEVGAHHDDDAMRHGVEVLLARRPQPTALVATGDFLAVEALTVAADLGIDVPTELSVTGFDDMSLASLTSPALTTVAQPSRAKGMAAGRRLLELLAGRAPVGPVVLDTDLVVRESTAPPP